MKSRIISRNYFRVCCGKLPTAGSRASTHDGASHEGRAVEFLTRPFNDEVLLRTTRQSLGRSREALGRKAQIQELGNSYGAHPSRTGGDGVGGSPDYQTNRQAESWESARSLLKRTGAK